VGVESEEEIGMTQKNSPDEIYVEFTNKVRNVCSAIILNGYSIYYYVKFCCNDIQEALDVADWCLYEGNAGEFKETDTYKVELKKYE